jgi:hypothetical protein
VKATERFLAKVKKGEGDSCWNWTGSKSGSGYGQFWFDGKLIPAHWFLLETKPTGKQEACHACDNRLCVRPDHIFLGSHRDNMMDMISKGRHNVEALSKNCRIMLLARKTKKGKELPQSKVTNEIALEIRLARKEYGVLERLSQKFGISKATVSDIRNGRTWKHI